jgi:hypothetical protein
MLYRCTAFPIIVFFTSRINNRTVHTHSAFVVTCIYCTTHVIQHYPLGGIAFADTHLHKYSATVQQATTATAAATSPGSIELVDVNDSHTGCSSSPKLHATPAAKLFDSKGNYRLARTLTACTAKLLYNCPQFCCRFEHVGCILLLVLEM